MKYFRVLPAIASVIALAATFAFARDFKGGDDGNYYRTRIETRDAKESADEVVSHDLPAAIDSETGEIYRVGIDRANELKMASKEYLPGGRG